MFIELHLIQNFSPANLNRDDTNNPKDCEFGGHRRARISSQALKRAIRRLPIFAEKTGVSLGERTKWMTRPIKDQLMEAGKSEDLALSVATAFVTAYASKMEKNKPNKTTVLIYFSQEEIAGIVQGLLSNWDTAVAAAKDGKSVPELVKDLERKTEGRTSAPDIALFGRMLAEHPNLNIDAACQASWAKKPKR